METIKKIIATKEKVCEGWEKNKKKVYLVLIILAVLTIIAATAYVTWKIIQKLDEKDIDLEDDFDEPEDDFLDDAEDE